LAGFVVAASARFVSSLIQSQIKVKQLIYLHEKLY